jgi:aerobic carbon-monoxide dehydrogenase small subunit
MMTDATHTEHAEEARDVEHVHDVTVTVNGVRRTAAVPARRLLSDFLRHDLRLTGTHVGCEHGVCGACTVLVDGEPMRSCLMFAVSAQRHEVTTVEGLGAAADARVVATGESMSPVQQAFAECHGLQCGFCTPGFLTTITAYLAENPSPTSEQAREAISGNLCRCTGYQNIVKSVLRAAEITAERGAERPEGTAELTDERRDGTGGAPA